MLNLVLSIAAEYDQFFFMNFALKVSFLSFLPRKVIFVQILFKFMATYNNISYLKHIGSKACWFTDRFQPSFKEFALILFQILTKFELIN